MMYQVPSLALNYPCKEYQIICQSVHSYLCTCMRNKYPHARVNLYEMSTYDLVETVPEE